VTRLRNVPVVASNLIRLCLRRAARVCAIGLRALREAGKRSRRLGAAVAGATRTPAEWSAATRRATVRASRRLTRFDEHVLTPMRDELATERRIRAAAGGRTIVVGPWVSEVGYEVLYWLPFLRWFQDRFRVSPDRMVAISRGGVDWWYEGIAARYVDALDVFTPEEFAEQSGQRRSAGDQKQLEPSAWERQIADAACRRLRVGEATVLPPGSMYRLYRHFWHGDRALEFLFRHTVYEHLTPPGGEEAWLPETFAAVKFYTGAALPDTPQTRERLRAHVARLADRMPIVALDTGLGFDEHQDYLFSDIPGVIDLRDRLSPRNNLGLQSRVIARARLFVGTCGSLAWLAPMLGVPTIAVYADDRYLSAHLYAARYAYRRMNAARFSAVDLRALETVSGAA
jgi:hypothetical protein